jgi:hypothetical protein
MAGIATGVGVLLLMWAFVLLVDLLIGGATGQVTRGRFLLPAAILFHIGPPALLGLALVILGRGV